MNNYKWFKFNELYKMSSGISSSPKQAGHGSPFVSFSTVFNNYFLPNALNELMDSSMEEQETFSVKKGDIFLTRTSETLDELGMSSVSIKDYPNATFSGFVKRLRPLQNDKTYDKYMAFYLRSRLFRKTITNNAVMVLRASLNEKIFSYLRLFLPDYKTQVKIGDILYLLYSKIELNNRIIFELEKMAKTIYDYWFVQFDFPDENGRPYKSSGGKMVWNEELKREIPEGWERIKIGDLLSKNNSKKKIAKSKIQLNGEIPIIDQSTEFIAGFTNDLDSIIESGIPKIIFGDHTRILKFINFDFAQGADGTQILFSNNKRMPQHLFFQALNQIDLSNYGYARHFKFLKDLYINLPKENVAQKYDLIVKYFFDNIKVNIFQNLELSKLRDWLLPMLMNGQVKVR